MASLRARLLAGLLVVAAAGLVLLGAITYAEQRSFLIDRVDQQVRGGSPAVSHALQEQGVVPRVSSDGDHDTPPTREGPGGPPPSGGGGREGGGAYLPSGTYGEARSASGKVLGHVVLSYGETAPAAPNLPAHIPAGKVITVHAKGGHGPRYRVTATNDPFSSDTTIVAVPLSEVDQTLSRLALVELLVIGGILLAMGLVTFFVVRLGLRPLDRMGRTAGAIAAGDLARRVEPATPRTEVGRLGLALNSMLERLEQAFAERQASEDRLRRFLADASHELRTPLVSIRGYAELYRIGAVSDPAEAERAMGRIEDEAARMGMLVEDLLTLARLDEVRDPVREVVDISHIARDAVDDARAGAPRRDIELRTGGPTAVTGDPHQLRQVLGNLIRNALVHTPPRTPIEVSVSRANGEVQLEVRDHGPGLPAADMDALFDRFWRAEGGRERGRAGAGLGLSIVAAIVAAHDGSVVAANASGGGARFTVRLPAGAASERHAPRESDSGGSGAPPSLTRA